MESCDPNDGRDDSSLDAVDVDESSRNFAVFARLIVSLFPDASSLPTVAVLRASFDCIVSTLTLTAE